LAHRIEGEADQGEADPLLARPTRC